MMTRIVFTFLLVLFAGSFSVTAAHTQDKNAEVRKLLEERDREIKQVLGTKSTFTDAQREKLKDVVNQGIDFEGMGRQALGDFWAKTPSEKRNEFVDVFSEIVRAQSLSNLDVYRSKVTYDKVTVEGDSAHVVTTTVYKDVPTEVRYELAKKGDEWLVQDIILDGVSTAEGYARSFQTVIRKKGLDTLMSSLHKKLEKMSS